MNIEDNRLIAEFLGSRVTVDTYFINGMYMSIDDSELKFHSDWNWLMEIIEKIKVINQTAVGEFKDKLLHYQRNNKTIFDLSILECKEVVFDLGLEFSKWYITNK